MPASTLVSTSLVASAEYFIDTDPGYGNGIALPGFTAADTVDLNLNVDLTGVTEGFHKLFVRFKEDNGTYGVYEGRAFYVMPANTGVNTSLVASAEYFFNTDPGYGNGTALPGFTPEDTVNLMENIDVSALPIDVDQQLFIRFRDDAGVWGIYEGRTFKRLPCDPSTAAYSLSNPICDGDAVSFTDQSTITDVGTTYEWDIDNDGITDYTTEGDITHTYATAGTYEVELKLTFGACVDSVVQTVVVGSIFNTNVAINVCYDASHTFGDGTVVSNIIADFDQTSYLTSVNGCDSTVVASVTVLAPVVGVDVISVCDTYTWVDGNTYTTSNNTATFVYAAGAVNGCDSTVTLDLTINTSYSEIDVIDACNTYTWIDGVTYTTNNNTATQLLTSIGGCDSLVTLDLTISTTLYSTDVVSACAPITWVDGNVYSANNNSATFTYVTTGGCDSIVTLNLTMGQPNTGVDVITACDTYTWIDGNIYTSSNTTAIQVLTNVSGCDSTVTLNLTINNSTVGTDVITACDTYTWIDGNVYTADNVTATHVLTGTNGCDSLVTLNLTIGTATTGTDVVSGCGSYTWIDGVSYTTDNSTATHMLQTVVGCDSLVTLNLTMYQPSVGTDVLTACDTYTWIDGNVYTSSNNTATHTLMNAVGCDSIVTLDLTISNSTIGTDVITACDSYTWIDGTTYTSSNTTATHLLTNSVGCDSTVTLDLTINNSTTSVDVVSGCVSYTWIDGNSYTSDNMTATFMLTSVGGCDSLVTLNLTMNNSITGIDTQLACSSYTWIDGNTYTSSNTTATHTLQSVSGCDSIVTLNLTIESNINVATTVVNATVIASEVNATAYQWLDCDNGSVPIVGATNQTFTAVIDGQYAVVVTIDNCSDTSECVQVFTTGLTETVKNGISIYPNPTADKVYISLDNEASVKMIELFDVSGKMVNQLQGVNESILIELMLPNQPGVYFIHLIDNNNLRTVFKQIKT